jgi:hypothetical protein
MRRIHEVKRAVYLESQARTQEKEKSKIQKEKKYTAWSRKGPSGLVSGLGEYHGHIRLKGEYRESVSWDGGEMGRRKKEREEERGGGKEGREEV